MFLTIINFYLIIFVNKIMHICIFMHHVYFCLILFFSFWAQYKDQRFWYLCIYHKLWAQHRKIQEICPHTFLFILIVFQLQSVDLSCWKSVTFNETLLRKKEICVKVFQPFRESLGLARNTTEKFKLNRKKINSKKDYYLFY